MHQQPAMTAQTKQNIMDAFWSLYCEKRIDRITVREIAARAGYHRGTFYEYFTDVYDVLEQVEQALIPSENELPPTTGASDQPMDAFLKLYEQNNKYYSILLGSHGDPSFAAKLKASVKPVIISQIAGKGPYNDAETEYVAEFILSSMIGVLSYWFQNKQTLPAERLVALMSGLMNHGVMSSLHRQPAPTPPNHCAASHQSVDD